MRIELELGDYPSGTSLSSICRRLVREGIPQETLVHFTRGGTAIFSTDNTIAYWAALRVKESTDERFPTFVNYESDDKLQRLIAAE